MRCTRLAGNAGRRIWSKIRHVGTTAQLCRVISSQLRHISTIGKKLLNSDVFSTCPHNMGNFDPLVVEICWRVLGTAANFNGFRVLASLLHGTLVLGVSQTLRVEQRAPPIFGGRPSCWALAHISSYLFKFDFYVQPFIMVNI